MTEYLLSVWNDESVEVYADPETMQRAFDQVNVLNGEMQTAGAWVFGGGLHPSSSATVVHTNNDQVSMTDGPFVESKEHLGGFWVIVADDMDAALEWARKASIACRNPVEVRPFQG